MLITVILQQVTVLTVVTFCLFFLSKHQTIEGLTEALVKKLSSLVMTVLTDFDVSICEQSFGCFRGFCTGGLLL